MASQNDLDSTYMGTALLHARLSKARRSLVGAVLVTRQGVALTGFNGTAKGRDNNCEDEVFSWGWWNPPVLVTKSEVIHAELNCILKAAREGVSCLGGTIYVTLSPCVLALLCLSMQVSPALSTRMFIGTQKGCNFSKAVVSLWNNL